MCRHFALCVFIASFATIDAHRIETFLLLDSVKMTRLIGTTYQIHLVCVCVCVMMFRVKFSRAKTMDRIDGAVTLYRGKQMRESIRLWYAMRNACG